MGNRIGERELAMVCDYVNILRNLAAVGMGRKEVTDSRIVPTMDAGVATCPRPIHDTYTEFQMERAM